MMFKESIITINGRILTNGQSMTIRVAIESFASSLEEFGLGDDKHGKLMTKAYLKNINELREIIINKDL